jgi:hypothetical protein
VVVKNVTPPVTTKKRGGDGNPAHQRKLRSYEVEAHFYQHFASRCGAEPRLPKAYCCQKTDSGFLFILEDLDSAGYSGRRYSLREAELGGCLRWLAAFHAKFLGVAPEGLWKVGTYWQLSTRSEELAQVTDTALRIAAPKLDARLNQCRFRTLLHGDAKPANFCFSEEDRRVAAVDFQYTGGGCGMKDVAYLLDCCLDAHSAEHQTTDALDLYFGALRKSLEVHCTTDDLDALESEWRGLYPAAWADFARFLNGWAPGRYPPGEFSRALIAQAIGESNT